MGGERERQRERERQGRREKEVTRHILTHSLTHFYSSPLQSERLPQKKLTRVVKPQHLTHSQDSWHTHPVVARTMMMMILDVYT